MLPAASQPLPPSVLASACASPASLLHLHHAGDDLRTAAQQVRRAPRVSKQTTPTQQKSKPVCRPPSPYYSTNTNRPCQLLSSYSSPFSQPPRESKSLRYLSSHRASSKAPGLAQCTFRDSFIVAELAHDPDAGGAGTDHLPDVAQPDVTHSTAGRAHALVLAPQLPASHLLLFLRRLRCLPEFRMRDEMERLALRLPFPDEGALAREAADVAAAEAEAEEATRREAELARGTPKGDRGARGGAGRAWKRQLWLIILADLVILGILFAAWLAVCRGFSCIGR